MFKKKKIWCKYFDKCDDKWKLTGGRKISVGVSLLSFVEGKNVFTDINAIHHVCVTITHAWSINQISYRAASVIMFTDGAPNRK